MTSPAAAAADGWEARMAARARRRPSPGPGIRRRIAELRGRDAYLAAMFGRYYEPGDPDDILPEILAARCLGIEYGDPGSRHGPEVCRECWGECRIWLGNCWGAQHARGIMNGCEHPCHEGEVWLA